MADSRIATIQKKAHDIDVRINLFDGYLPKEIVGKGEAQFWRLVSNIYGLFADCDRVQVHEKKNLIELMFRYDLIERQGYEAVFKFWNDVSDLRKWFCHNNDASLYYPQLRNKRIQDFLNRAFSLASDKPTELEAVKPKDWDALSFYLGMRFDEYYKLLENGLIAWKESDDISELVDEWIVIQASALFSNKELIRNVLAEIADYNRINNGIRNMSTVQLANVYFYQLESGGFSENDFIEEMKNNKTAIRSNKEIVIDAIRNSKLV